MQQYIMQHRYEHRLLEEAEAGRKFLQELRKPHDNDVELDEGFSLDMTADYVANGKEKKVSLRASLERLIEEYLRKITTDNDEYEIESRQRRHSHNITIIDILPTNDSASGTNPTIHETIFEDDDNDDDGNDEDDFGESVGSGGNQDDFDDAVLSGNGANEDDDELVISGDDDIDANDVERIELGTQKINVTSGSGDHEEMRSRKKAKNRKGYVPQACFENKRRISHLDKIELENSLKNLSQREFNIRNLLNYR